MPDSGNTVTITAALVNDVSRPAEEAGASVKGMADRIRDSAGGAATAIEALGARLDTTTSKMGSLGGGVARSSSAGLDALGQSLDDTTKKSDSSGSSMSQTSRHMREMAEQSRKLKEGIAGVGDSIKERVQYPLQQLSYFLEASAAGMVTLGLTTEASVQKMTLSLSAFTGSTGGGTAAFNALHKLEGPDSMGSLESSFESLTQAGMRSGQIMPLITALSNLSTVSQNPNGTLSSMTSALASMHTTGLITGSDASALSAGDPTFWSQLSKETEQSQNQLRKMFAFGGEIGVPTDFFSGLENSSLAKTGLSKYRNTWDGEIEKMKVSFEDLLKDFEKPLGNALAGAATKFGNWADATDARFKQLGGTLGADWSTNNMQAFGTTLAAVFGDPKLSGDITMVGEDLHSLSTIVTKDFMPIAKDVLTIATPALKGLATVLDLLAAHKSTTEALIVILGGFEVFLKIGTWANGATKSLEAFTKAADVLGASKSAKAIFQGLTGLPGTKKLPGEDEPEAESSLKKFARSIESASSDIIKFVAPFAVTGSAYAVVGGGTAAQIYSQHYTDTHKSGGFESDALNLFNNIPASIQPGVSLLTQTFDKMAGYDYESKKKGTSDQSTPVTITGGVNITVPGSGNPQKVANAIPKALNAQITNFNQMAQRRAGGKSG